MVAKSVDNAMASMRGAVLGLASHAAPHALRRAASNSVVLFLLGLVCLAPLLLSPAVRVTVAPGRVQPEIGKAHIAPMATAAYRLFTMPSDDGFSQARSRLILYEDGRPLGPAHSPHAVIRERGEGAYSHWQGNLYFSSSDGSDPRTNGRLYTASAEVRLTYWLSLPLAGVALACFAAVRRDLRRRFGDATAGVGTQPARARATSLPLAACAGLAALVTIAAFALAWMGPLQYRTNDDVVMRFIAEGIGSDGRRSEFLMFQNVLVGLFLRAMYGVAPAVPWYDAALAAGTAAGAVLCQVAVLRLCRSLREILFCALVAVLFLVPMFQALQFTASALLLAAGAVLNFASVSLRPPASRPRLLAACAVIALALLLGSLVRFEAAFLALLAMLPIVLLPGLRRRRRPMLLPAAALLTGVVLALVCRGYDGAYYAGSPGWESVREEGKQRGRAGEYAFLEPSRIDEFDAALSAAHWTANDYRLLSGWLFADRQLFSAERMQRFNDLAPRQSLSERGGAAWRLLARPESLLWLTALLGVSAALLRPCWGGVLGVLVSLTWLATVLVVIVVTFKTGVEHIIWPLYAGVTLATAVAVYADAARARRRDRYLVLEERTIAALTLLGLACLATWYVGTALAAGRAAEQVRRQVARDLGGWPVREGDTVVAWDHNFPFELWARPFHRIPQTPWRFLHTTAAAATPVAEPIYAAWGTRDVAWAMCHVDGVYRVDARLGYAEPHARILTAYMQEHYREAVDVVPVFQGEALSLYTCRVRDAESGIRRPQ
jgi:hypothetical protein